MSLPRPSQESPQSPPTATQETAWHNGDLHLEAVGNPGNLKALDFKVYANGSLVVTVKNILAKPVGAEEVIREVGCKV